MSVAPQPPVGPIGEVLQDGYKKPFMLLIALVSVVTLVVGGLSKAETFVDGRIELKLAAERAKTEEQGARLAKIEEQFASMKDTLGEIRADVRVLRSKVESNWEAARASRRP